MQKIRHFFLLMLRGIAMGAADVVPGVSGGTIAFITGIYEELVDSIKSINLEALRLLFRKGVPAFWNHINGWFLLSVFAGILISVFSLAKILETLLLLYPIMVWSFFFGLIIASAITILKKIKQWKPADVIGIVAGSITAYFITVLSPAQTPESYWFVFLAGALAICAMILPGISGAFILLLLGKYAFMIAAISQLNVTIILIFALGAVVGLLTFSNLLSFLLHRFHDITVAVLAGFMIGSLNKVWPWKKVVETFTDRHGELQPLVEKNISPGTYQELTSEPSYLGYAILFALIGFFIIFIFEWLLPKKSE